MRQQQLEKFASSESGNVVTIFAVASIVIVGVTALAVDYSSFAEERSHLQAVADAGALHAAVASGICARPLFLRPRRHTTGHPL